MLFRVLGPLDLVADTGRPVVIRRRKVRLLLAILLFRANQLTSSQRLVDELWDGEPPPSAAANLVSYVSQLRSVFHDADPGTERIESYTGGYRLRLRPGEFDAAEFEALAAEGRRAARDKEFLLAAERFTGALGLWRGRVLQDLALPEPLLTEAARLEELRLGVLEDNIDAHLATGQHPDLVPELNVLTMRHPLRERLWAQLMLALYRDGRQAEALSTYQRARELLGRELGIDPGPELQRRHHQILSNDPVLQLPRVDASARAVEPTVPAQLPADLVSFTGRTTELDHLLSLACPAGGTAPAAVLISAIDGMAGIGKTALAVHAAHRLAPRFGDGQLFVDLHGFTAGMAPVEPAKALERILRALGVPSEQIPYELDDRAALYRSMLARRRILVVLDNAANESQVRPLLPGAAGCLVLITSRRRLVGIDDVQPLSLDIMSVADAVDLFTRIATADRLAGERTGQVNEIVELCGRLPLAVRIAAARLRHRPAWTLAHLAERLRDHRQRLAEFEFGQRSVAAALDLSYADLTADQRHMFRLLGLHVGPDIDRYAAAALAETSIEHSEQLLETLLDTHLIQQHEPGRYRLHDFLRAYAAHAAAGEDSEADQRAALSRLLDFYAHTASVATAVAYPFEAGQRPRPPTPDIPVPDLPDQAQAAGWLDAELANLLAAAAHAGRHGWFTHAVQLSTTLHRHLRTRARYTDAETLHTHALHAARRIPDRIGELHALNGLGHAHRMLDRIGPAADCYQQALAIARTTGDRNGELTTLNGLGAVHRFMGKIGPAADCYQQALAIARTTGDRNGELTTLNGLGDLHRLQGRLAPAADCYQQALAIARTIGNRTGELTTLNGLGAVHRLRGRLEPAADCYEQALGIARNTGQWSGEFHALCGLGDLHRLQGRLGPATHCYQQVLSLARAIGDRNYQIEALHGLGHTALATGQPAQAVAHHQAALDLARQLGQPEDEVRAHVGLASARSTLGDSEQARHHWQCALTTLTDLGLTRIEEIDADQIRAHLAELR